MIDWLKQRKKQVKWRWFAWQDDDIKPVKHNENNDKQPPPQASSLNSTQKISPNNSRSFSIDSTKIPVLHILGIGWVKNDKSIAIYSHLSQIARTPHQIKFLRMDTLVLPTINNAWYHNFWHCLSFQPKSGHWRCMQLERKLWWLESMYIQKL